MKKKILYIFGIFILAICFVSPFFYGIFVKNTDNLPKLESVIEMGEQEAEELLKGYRKAQLEAVWAEPKVEDSVEDHWETEDGSKLIVFYNEKEKIEKCEILVR